MRAIKQLPWPEPTYYHVSLCNGVVTGTRGLWVTAQDKKSGEVHRVIKWYFPGGMRNAFHCAVKPGDHITATKFKKVGWIGRISPPNYYNIKTTPAPTGF